MTDTIRIYLQMATDAQAIIDCPASTQVAIDLAREERRVAQSTALKLQREDQAKRISAGHTHDEYGNKYTDASDWF